MGSLTFIGAFFYLFFKIFEVLGGRFFRWGLTFFKDGGVGDGRIEELKVGGEAREGGEGK